MRKAYRDRAGWRKRAEIVKKKWGPETQKPSLK